MRSNLYYIRARQLVMIEDLILFKMIKEFERVVLTENLNGTPFVKGDVGTVVMIHNNGKGYEVEFFAADGSTLGVETVEGTQVISAKHVKKVLHIID
ncbi:MAG: DUF4926 domain-containing protein [Chitinophagales bacterium]|nr:DUF4926 domain-containing protein [Chitinophagales bacterium]